MNLTKSSCLTTGAGIFLIFLAGVENSCVIKGNRKEELRRELEINACWK